MAATVAENDSTLVGTTSGVAAQTNGTYNLSA
jgi:hypothetical protein